MPAFDPMLIDHIRREIGQRIREARQELGMSQADLAVAMERRQAYISELETGKTEPDITTVIQLSRVLQQPAVYFVPPGYRDLTNQLVDSTELTDEESALINRIRTLELGFSYKLALRLLNTLVEYGEHVEEEVNRTD